MCEHRAVNNQSFPFWESLFQAEDDRKHLKNPNNNIAWQELKKLFSALIMNFGQKIFGIFTVF